jgi:RNA polymerase subunit RPABC4/transcription elongation factor Spt4
VETDYEQHSERVYVDGGGSYLKTWEVPNVYTNTETRVGCPLCKSTAYTFEDPAMKGYRRCKQCKQFYDHDVWDECPMCNPDADPSTAIGFYESAEGFAVVEDTESSRGIIDEAMNLFGKFADDAESHRQK